MTPNLDMFFGLIADAKKAGRHPMKDGHDPGAGDWLSEADAVGLLAKLDAELLPPGEKRDQAEGG